jgi:hypothetical protein
MSYHPLKISPEHPDVAPLSLRLVKKTRTEGALAVFVDGVSHERKGDGELAIPTATATEYRVLLVVLVVGSTTSTEWLHAACLPGFECKNASTIQSGSSAGTRGAGHRETPDIWWHAPSPVEFLVGLAG